jgi:hypothetical protein
VEDFVEPCEAGGDAVDIRDSHSRY